MSIPARRRWLTGTCWLMVSAHAVYLAVEMEIAGGWTEAEAVGSLLIILALISPAMGFAWLTTVTAGKLRGFACAILVASTIGIVALSYWVLHLALPDAQNALVIPVAAFGQFILLIFVLGVGLIARLFKYR